MLNKNRWGKKTAESQENRVRAGKDGGQETRKQGDLYALSSVILSRTTMAADAFKKISLGVLWLYLVDF